MRTYGYISTFLTCVYRIPIIYELYIKKDPTLANIKSTLIYTIACIFLILHGYKIKDTPVLILGIVCLIQSLIIIHLYKQCKTTKSNIIIL